MFWHCFIQALMLEMTLIRALGPLHAIRNFAKGEILAIQRGLYRGHFKYKQMSFIGTRAWQLGDPFAPTDLQVKYLQRVVVRHRSSIHQAKNVR